MRERKKLRVVPQVLFRPTGRMEFCKMGKTVGNTYSGVW